MNGPQGCRVIIKGRVQGVYYRAAAKEKAEELGLSGWVRNIPGGGVEALFEGDTGKIKEMICWCYNGPPDAVVTNVEASWEPFTGKQEGFKITY